MSGDSARPKKVLVFRLSSLGDVVVAASALEALSRQEVERVDWVVAKEFEPLLAGHPLLQKIWAFDRKKGLIAWISLCLRLRSENYDLVLDLHRTLRTRVARVLLGARGRSWRTLSKDRLRLYGYFLFKRLWPWRPRPLHLRCARIAGGSGGERPDLRHLITGGRGNLVPFEARRYLCVMPGSRWRGKQWPARNYFEVLQKTTLPPVVLGSKSDPESEALSELLAKSGRSFFSGVGKWTLPEVARVLADSAGYLGNDTGLAHLAEAVGVPANVVFGPTTADMGFGPISAESRSFESKIWCRPCGKDGRFCFRLMHRYACLSRIDPTPIVNRIEEFR